MLAFDLIKSLIVEFDKRGVVAITLSGGEPLLYPHIWELLSFVKDNTRLKVALNTNGMLLNQQHIEMLKERNVTDIQISLDGEEETHEKIRGQKTYQRTIAGIKRCIDNGIRVRVGYTINAVNSRDIASAVSHSVQLGAASIAFYRYVPTSIRDINRELDLVPRQLMEISSQLVNLNKEYSSDEFSIYFEPLSFFSFLIEEKLFDHTKCLAGAGQLNISPLGDVVLCSHYRVNSGNIYSDTIENIWKHQNNIGSQYRDVIPDECADCRYSSRCKGGCKGIALAHYGNADRKDPGCFYHLCDSR